jgi:hypothetical protein
VSISIGVAVAREVVDHVQSAEDAPVGKLVRHEVQRPAVVRSLRNRERDPRSGRYPLAQTAPHHQPFAAIEPMDSFVVDLEAFATQQHVQPTVAAARTLASQDEEPLTQPSMGSWWGT